MSIEHKQIWRGKKRDKTIPERVSASIDIGAPKSTKWKYISIYIYSACARAQYSV